MTWTGTSWARPPEPALAWSGHRLVRATVDGDHLEGLLNQEWAEEIEDLAIQLDSNSAAVRGRLRTLVDLGIRLPRLVSLSLRVRETWGLPSRLFGIPLERRTTRSFRHFFQSELAARIRFLEIRAPFGVHEFMSLPENTLPALEALAIPPRALWPSLIRSFGPIRWPKHGPTSLRHLQSLKILPEYPLTEFEPDWMLQWAGDVRVLHVPRPHPPAIWQRLAPLWLLADDIWLGHERFVRSNPASSVERELVMRLRGDERASSVYVDWLSEHRPEFHKFVVRQTESVGQLYARLGLAETLKRIGATAEDHDVFGRRDSDELCVLARLAAPEEWSGFEHLRPRRR